MKKSKVRFVVGVMMVLSLALMPPLGATGAVSLDDSSTSSPNALGGGLCMKTVLECDDEICIYRLILVPCRP